MRSRPWLCISTMATAAAFALSGASLAQSCGDPAAGSCCSANGTPACDDATCCEIICGLDPFCCDTAWDTLCANAALANCPELCGGGGGGCGEPGTGDCCVANGTPACEDGECCNIVCSLDPFCCETAWDQICANAAFANCPETCSLGGICGPDNPQDCCVAGGAPGCNDENCCNAVCAADPFCCQTAWDEVCAGAAALTCIELCGVPCDTTCPAGAHIEAELCGEDTNGGCNGGGFYEDIAVPGAVCGTFWAEGGTRDTDWYRFNLAEPSIVTITINTTAPALIGLLDTTCGPLVYVLEPAGCGSSVSFCLPAGQSVAFVAPAGFEGLPCGGEFNDYVLSITIDGACEPLVCGSPDTGDCCVANGTPFCDDAECCSAVCAADPFCCDTAWDQICADTAQLTCIELCGVPCDTTCPAGSQTEAELCGEDTNGGCNGGGIYEDISVPGTVCGTFWAEGGTRDTDWFRFNLEESTIVTVTINTSAPALIGLLDATCGPGGPGTVFVLQAASCGSSVSFCVPAGEAVVFVAPAGFEGLPCGSELNDYVVSISLDGACEATVCGTPGTGDCCVANGTPFCEDAECCEAICALDPFCCDTAWDQLCADAAVAQCAGCGGGGGGCGEPGTGDCCAANGTPFCDDAECCNLICAADPFCCNTAWDAICADAALAQCAVCSGGGVKNDECAGAFAITAGDTAFSTIGATTSLPPLDPSCDEGFGLAFVNDVWYAYLATATGTVTVSTCGQASYDTRLAAYTGSCETLSLVACNDDGAGCPGFTSLMTFEAVCGETYIIRVGGFAASGTGTITLTQDGTCPTECPADLDGDGSVGPSDLAILLGQWGGSGSADLSGNGSVGPEDLALLLGAWGPC